MAYFGEQSAHHGDQHLDPDGMKDITVDRLAPRQRLLAALDEVIGEKLNPAHHINAVESELLALAQELHGWLQ
ncbi:L-rhamnose isomerase [Shigella flexneri]